MESEALAVHGSMALVSELSISKPPARVLEEAREAALALREVIALKEKPVVFNGEQYLEFEDWQTVARFYGVTARVRSSRFVEYKDIHGWEAEADAVQISSGITISAAEAMCLNDEPKWSSKPKYEWQTVNGQRKRVQIGEEKVPLFQLRSMAQTRACAKALRNVMAWVVVLAGYRPTPAEEMIAGHDDPAPQPERRMPERRSEQTPRPAPPPAPPPKPAPQPAPAPPPKPGIEWDPGSPISGRRAAAPEDVISEPQRKRFYAIWKGTGVPEDIVKAKLREYGYEHSTEILRSDYEELCAWASEFGKLDPRERSDYDDSQ